MCKHCLRFIFYVSVDSSHAIFVGVGYSMVQCAGPSMLGQYFKKKRGMVEAVIIIGTGGGRFGL